MLLPPIKFLHLQYRNLSLEGNEVSAEKCVSPYLNLLFIQEELKLSELGNRKTLKVRLFRNISYATASPWGDLFNALLHRFRDTTFTESCTQIASKFGKI